MYMLHKLGIGVAVFAIVAVVAVAAVELAARADEPPKPSTSAVPVPAPVRDAGPEFWSLCRLDRHLIDPDDVLFEIESQDGPVYSVVAKSPRYEAMAEPALNLIRPAGSLL